MLFQVGDQRGRRLGVAEIERRELRLAAALGDGSGDFFQRRFVAPGQHDVTAFGGEPFRDRSANAAARAGDEGDFAGQSQFHDTPYVTSY